MNQKDGHAFCNIVDVYLVQGNNAKAVEYYEKA